MRAAVIALILFAALVNLAPVSGVVSAEALHALYGVAIDDPNLLILMRHRALLFGIVGVLLVASAVRAALRPLAYAVAFTSMLSFVAIAWLVEGENAQLQRIARIDLAASVALLAAAALDRRSAHP